MTRSDEIMQQLRALKPGFLAMGLKRVRVFGSVVRGQAGPDSDVDLLVDFFETPDAFKFLDVQYNFEEKLGAKVDLLTIRALHPALKDRILAEAADV